jgi:hypothetical protein
LNSFLDYMNNMIKFKQKWCFLAMLVFGITTISPVSGAEKPNIVIILTDDMGRSDLGCYGATRIQTPNIDQMARYCQRKLK